MEAGNRDGFYWIGQGCYPAYFIRRIDINRSAAWLRAFSLIIEETYDIKAELLDLEALPETLQGLVYCPGTSVLKPFQRLTIDDFMEDFAINLLGAVRLFPSMEAWALWEPSGKKESIGTKLNRQVGAFICNLCLQFVSLSVKEFCHYMFSFEQWWFREFNEFCLLSSNSEPPQIAKAFLNIL